VENVNWKNYLHIREYDFNPLLVDVTVIGIQSKLSEASSYRDLISLMGLDYGDKLKRKIYDLIKRNKLDTTHFKRSKINGNTK